MHHLATVIAASVLLATAAGAAPKACGDDVDGRGTAVPCDCGDVLVGSRSLTDADPLVQHPCDTTALVVDVPADRTGPTLRLAGHLVRGRGRGFGLQVLRAGSTGLHLIGPGEVRGFDVGVVAWGGTLASADGVVAAENHSDGFEVNGTGYAITAC